MAESKVSGGCHCGKVRFEATADLSGGVLTCNCSICQKRGLMLTFVPPEKFTLKSGKDELREYQFNKKVIHHLFCSSCGVQSYSRGVTPQGAEMVAINVRCLDGVDLGSLRLTPFDGRRL